MSSWQRSRLTLSQQAHQDVGVERPLVSLVEDDDAVAVQIAFVERLAKHHTVRHVYEVLLLAQTQGERARRRPTLDDGLLGCAVLETDAVADFGAELALGKEGSVGERSWIAPSRTHLHLLRDTLRDTHSGDTTRLRATDEAVLRVAFLVQELGELRRLAGTGLADDHDDCTSPRETGQCVLSRT